MYSVKKEFFRVVIDGCAIIALGISLFLVFAKFPNTSDTAFDYQAILVGILAAIFTLLVGWNIFNVVDFKRKESVIDDLSVKITNELDKCHFDTSCSMAISMNYVAILLSSRLIEDSPNLIMYKMTMAYLSCIAIYNHIGKFESSNKQLNDLMTKLGEIKSISLTESQKSKILIKIGSVEHRDRLDKIEELITYLSA